jgi:hypothetical protein
LNKILSPRVNYQPLIEVRVFKDALPHNLSVFQQKYPKTQFAPAIKSNAYGHGMVEVAGILDAYNQNTLSVPRLHSGHLPQRGEREHSSTWIIASDLRLDPRSYPRLISGVP